LNDLSSLERDASAHEDKEDGRKGDDPKASDLKEKDGDHLPRNGQIFSDIDDH
jgi:hypothetical protein